MGGCCCKSADVVPIDENGEYIGGKALQIDVSNGKGGRGFGSPGASRNTPNLFKVLQLGGLDENGDVGKMRVGACKVEANLQQNIGWAHNCAT